ncbi:hypothetical protein H8S90_24295 [Olivibacter sp. SDN3]|uniref:MauE/DoxX family redox-associated membrane protein n=1 Tax=Olivibacter sp. SDN3 TaxID=2764720 RepID=UPI001651923D|nr:MauE/DoxX family redox-associated membrane protein [Olivibacter sp. SDN3]QNL49789.1 hypothetical protein H8S90_24295 [Olivibacter sp. SDN3]
MKAVISYSKSIFIHLWHTVQNFWNVARSWDWKEIFSVAVVMLTILLFSYTAVSKLLDHERFVFQMRLAPVPLMKTVAPFVGWILPFIELAVAFILYKEKTRYLGFIASLILMILFEIYISWMKIVSITTGVDLPCTCGGIISQMGWGQHLIFNAVYIILLALAIYWHKKEPLGNDRFKLTNIYEKP